MLRTEGRTQEKEEMREKFAYSMAAIWHLKPQELPEAEMQLIERLYHGALEAAGGTTSRAQTMAKRGLPCTHTPHMHAHSRIHAQLDQARAPKETFGMHQQQTRAHKRTIKTFVQDFACN